MAAAKALITMTAQCRGAAADDGIEHLAMRPCKMRLLLFPKSCCPFDGRCRPPQGWAGSSSDLPPGTLHLVRTGYLDGFERTGNRLQMAPGQVQIDGGMSELGVSEKNLNGAQVGAGFQHVCCEAVPQSVRRYMLSDPGTLGGLVHGLPDDLLCNGHVGSPALHRTWEQVGLGLHPAPVLAQSLQQLRSQQHIAVPATLALAYMNDHTLAVDIGDREMAQLGPAQAGCIQHHQHGAMHQVAGRVDQSRHLLLVKYGRQSTLPLGKWNVIGKVWPAKRLDEKKTQCRRAAFDGPGRELALAK